jgi:transcriptional regulator with XRE-family HTH domain
MTPHPPREEFRQIDRHVGKRLKQLRTMRGQTLMQIGDVLDREYQQIQKYESGANRISAAVLYKLSKHFQIPLSSFFEGLTA